MNSKSKLNKLERNLIQLTPKIKSILVGLILSDAWFQKRGGWNPRIGFKQSIKNFEYLWHVFNNVSVLCSNFPYLCKTITRGKLFFALQFETRQLDCLNEIYNLFYKSQQSSPHPFSRIGSWDKGEASPSPIRKGVPRTTAEPEKITKLIKLELFEYLDYLAIAHWIMGDGAKRNKGITLCTDSFTIQEVVLLMNILLIKHNIKTTIHKEKFNYAGGRIYINESELKKIIPLIKPYFVKSFLYKIS